MGNNDFPYDGLGLDIWSGMIPRERNGINFDHRKEGRREEEKSPIRYGEQPDPTDTRGKILSRMDMNM